MPVTTAESLVRALLLADPKVSAAVGGVRVYPLVMPQGAALPAITYQRVATLRVSPLTRHEQVSAVRLQLDCFAASYAAVKELAFNVAAVLDAYTGPVGAPAPVLHAIRAMPDERDEFEPDPPTYRVSGDYSVWWKEA